MMEPDAAPAGARVRSSRTRAAPGLRPGALWPPLRGARWRRAVKACPRLERRSHPKGAGVSGPGAGRNGTSESAARRRMDAAMERRTARTLSQRVPAPQGVDW